jgi:hypothetical protein
MDNVWELDFSLDTKPTDPLGRLLTRFGLPLQSAGEQATQRFQQLVSMMPGRDAQDTPLALSLVNLGVNLLATTPPIRAQRERLGRLGIGPLRVDSIAVVANPANNTYGGTIQFKF